MNYLNNNRIKRLAKQILQNMSWFKNIFCRSYNLKAVLYVKEKITNSEYQKIHYCSQVTANSDLTELVQKDILLFNDVAGAGVNYPLKVIAS